MTDIANRLRSEARAVPATADRDLAARVRARLPTAMPEPVPHLRFPVGLAAAALLAVSFGLAWQAARDRQPGQHDARSAVTLPTPPSLDEMIGSASSRLPQGAMTGEFAALEADLAAVVQTVRGAVPF